MERKPIASSTQLIMVLGLAFDRQPADVAGQLAHGWLEPCHGADLWGLERVWSFVRTLMGHREANLRCCRGGSDYRSQNRGNNATPEEGQGCMGIKTKSIGLQAFLIALLMEQLVVKFHDTDCFSAYFSLGNYMKQIPDELSHLTMG